MIAADAAALAQGIRPGMTVALAQATVPGLLVADMDREGDAAGLARLAVWALRYSPLVAPDPPDGLVLDVTGASHLFGGDACLLADLLTRIEHSGIHARAAIAGTWAAAWALARFAPGTIAASDAGLAAITALPVAALRLKGELVESLRALGFETVGELAAAPRVSLALRFGTALTGRLDAIAGHSHELIHPVLAPTIPHASLRFAEPLGHLGALKIALGRLAGALCATLERLGLGARWLDLRFTRVDNQVSALRVGAARATRNAAHIARLFGEKLAAVDPGFGIEAAVLAATRVEPLAASQITIALADEANDADLAVLVDRIASRIGGARVYRVVPVESDVPERALTLVPALAPPTGKSWDDGPRPYRLFDPPQPVEVVSLLPDHLPAFFVWNGRRYRVVRADGAESVWAEWWRSDAEACTVRDYFRIEDAEGGRVWLFRATGRDGANRWFIHGVFA